MPMFCCQDTGVTAGINVNAAATMLVSRLKFRTEFDYGTAGRLQVFKVKGQGHGVTVQGHSVT